MFPWNKHFPFNQNEFTKKFNSMNPKDVEEYIQTVMNNVFGNGPADTFPFLSESSNDIDTVSNPLHFEPRIFETNEFIFARLPIKEDDLSNLTITHTSHYFYLKIKAVEQKFILPSPVKRKGTKVQYMDGYLELRFLKVFDNSISEVNLSL